MCVCQIPSPSSVCLSQTPSLPISVNVRGKKSCCFHATHFTFYNGMTAIKNTTDMQLNDLMMGRVVVGVGEEKIIDCIMLGDNKW